MIDPENTKTATTRTLRTLTGTYEGDNDRLLQELRQRYIGTKDSEYIRRGYSGIENDALDAPRTKAELFAAAQALRKNSAPGEDRVTNLMLRNLSDEQLERLVHYFNEQIWETGHLPQQWKDATVILIPKAGKARSLQNLRPISLTSCLGKL